MGNLPFRRICVDFGADITCSEMVLAHNLLKSQASDWALIRRHPSEKVFGVQFAVRREEEARAVCELARREMSMDFVDLNVGCPMDAVERSGAGAGLLTKVGRLKRVVRGMLNSLENVPLVVKIRTGDHENTSHRLIPQLQALRGRDGRRVDAVVVHGRTKQGRYTKKADWECVVGSGVSRSYIRTCSLAQRSDLPRMTIVGNGDVFNPSVRVRQTDDEKEYWSHLHDHAVDGVMIGRGALIKPWLCTEIKEHRSALSDSSPEGNWDISASERLDMIRAFCEYGLEHWGSDRVGVERTRSFLLEWLSFLCRYVPFGILERPQLINQRPCAYYGRSELETLLGSRQVGCVERNERIAVRLDSDFRNVLRKGE